MHRVKFLACLLYYCLSMLPCIFMKGVCHCHLNLTEIEMCQQTLVKLTNITIYKIYT